jgi:hypothetical protein
MAASYTGIPEMLTRRTVLPLEWAAQKRVLSLV